jgi:predicted N-acyltransferase
VTNLEAQSLGGLAEVGQAEWNALLRPDDNPFVDWRWLEALEHSGCVGPEASFLPCHLTLRRAGRLIAAAPAYVKFDSDGDFGRDWDWAAAAERGQLPYYPKLVLGVPFTPVTGRRILVAAGEDEPTLVAAVVAAAQQFVAKQGLGSLHVLFPTEQQTALLAATGLIPRIGIQYHWQNPGYRTSEEFYARFSSKRRHALRHERAAAAAQGISVRTVHGAELLAAPQRWADLAHDLHRSTVDKLMWGRRWLNQAFYRRVFAALPAAMQLVVAEREGRVIAGAFNVAGANRLFGRYWGCFEDHPFLHFTVCYYHSIDRCIAEGTQVFEGGAGGEHKIARGFEPAPTYSAHAFSHRGLHQALKKHIEGEATHRAHALSTWHAEAKVLKPLPGGA